MQQLLNSPCGSLVPTIEGQRAFVPDPLPRELYMSPGLVWLLDRASRAIATLAGVGETLQSPQLLTRPLLRREAVLSSRIEGTIASLSDVFSYEVSHRRPSTPREAGSGQFAAAGGGAFCQSVHDRQESRGYSRHVSRGSSRCPQSADSSGHRPAR